MSAAALSVDIACRRARDYAPLPRRCRFSSMPRLMPPCHVFAAVIDVETPIARPLIPYARHVREYLFDVDYACCPSPAAAAHARRCCRS